MSYGKISAKQREILEYIKDSILNHGYPPAVREISDAVNLRSTSSVHSHLETLEKNGYIRRDPTKPRAIEVCDDGFNMVRTEIVSIPVIGQVAAGTPILAEQNIEDMIPLPLSFIRGDSTDTFILNVHGDSMIQAGILDGDYVVVHSQITARNGEIVVAMIDDEVTVKRFFREADYIRLQPENDMYSPILVRDVQILGKVVALLRQF